MKQKLHKVENQKADPTQVPSEGERASRYESRFTLAAALASMTDALFITNASGELTDYNDAFAAFHKFPSKTASHPSLLDYPQKFNVRWLDDRPVPKDQWAVACALRGEVATSVEYKLRRQDSGEEWIGSFSYSPIRAEAGEIVGAVVIARDVTQAKAAETALRNREHQLSAILNTAADAIITIDRQGSIILANAATERMFGYRLSQLIGQNVKILMPEPFRSAHDASIRRYMDTGVGTMVGRTRELLAKRQDGSTFPVRISLSEVDHLQLFTGVVHDISERVLLQKQVLEIAAEEDRRIGQELHDNLQQQLTGLTLMAATLADILESKGLAESAIAAKLASNLNEASRQAQQLARGLVPVDVDANGLNEALSKLAEQTSQQCDIACVFVPTGDIGISDNTVATHFYRIAQEAVTNAIKHGSASRITISLSGEDNALELKVEDNGTGLPANSAQSNGLGLQIMGYRASLIGARLYLHSPEHTDASTDHANRGTILQCILARN